MNTPSYKSYRLMGGHNKQTRLYEIVINVMIETNHGHKTPDDRFISIVLLCE